ncbi:MAG: hypothetical protein EPN82_06960 [Bacteroidetes bacterium]|nr:MAG: hypothetical protein EPN82_06960 [Bacteroidota bacterium]
MITTIGGSATRNWRRIDIMHINRRVNPTVETFVALSGVTPDRDCFIRFSQLLYFVYLHHFVQQPNNIRDLYLLSN